MTPVRIEVVIPLLTSLEFSCRRCSLLLDQVDTHQNYHRECSEEYPQEWKREVEKLSEWIRNVSHLYKHRIQIKIIDAQSPLGLWKQVRHRVFRLPAFIVDRQHVCTGWDTDKLEALIDQRIRDDAVLAVGTRS